MAITSIMRDKLGTTKSLGTITLHPNESASEVLRKGTMFIRRNLNKREHPVTEQEIKDILGYLFDINGNTLQFQQGVEERTAFKDDEDKKAYESLKKQYGYMSWETDSKSGYKAEDMQWTQFKSSHSRNKEQTVTVFIGKPNQIKSAKNGAIYSYKSIDGLTMQINVDRLVSIGVLVKMYKDVGVIGEDPILDKFIRRMVHDTLPQSKTQASKNWGYKPSPDDLGLTREEFSENFQKAIERVKDGFKRAYRMEVNIKSMEEYEKGLRGSVATAFETKKNIPDNILNAMKQSTFLNKGFKFVELDEDTDLEKYQQVANYYIDIEHVLPKLPLQALRFRKLGKHRIGGNRVSGLYSPSHRSIAVDLRMFDSFIHEYGHAIDYMYENGEIQSMQYGFTDILNKYEDLLPGDVSNKSYYLTPTEVFARGFEVAFRSKYPNLDTGLVPPVEKLRAYKPYQPFYQNKELYDAVIEYMGEYLK